MYAAAEVGSTLRRWRRRGEGRSDLVELIGEAFELSDPVRDLRPLRYTDGSTETISAGQAYYLAPGHNARVDDDGDLVEFTPDDQSPDMAR